MSKGPWIRIAPPEEASKAPGEMTEADIDGLRAEGWTDPQIVATVHVASFFAYMNRVAEAFGLSHAS